MPTEPQDVAGDERPDGTDRSDREASSGDLGRGEQIASAVVGGVLLAAGIRRRSLGGAAMTLVGGWLCYRGLVGDRPAGMLSDEDGDAGEDGTDGAGGSDGDDEDDAVETVDVTRSVTVDRPADELYDLWRDPDTMRRVFAGAVSVTAQGEDHWRWTLNGPRGWGVSWDTSITEARPGEALRWETDGDAASWSEGSVEFRDAPAERGTEMTFEFRLEPPGGRLGEAVATRLGVVPGTLVERVLDRFKSLAETGEIPTLEKNPSARGQGDRI